jgi:hypothetical protein
MTVIGTVAVDLDAIPGVLVDKALFARATTAFGIVVGLLSGEKPAAQRFRLRHPGIESLLPRAEDVAPISSACCSTPNGWRHRSLHVPVVSEVRVGRCDLRCPASSGCESSTARVQVSVSLLRR